MAYVERFDYDVFVSYAHNDNDGDEPWVTQFVDDVRSEISKRLGTDKVEIFQDLAKFRGHGLVEELKQKAHRSALFVPIVTPSYVAREWTIAELNAFNTGGDRLKHIFAVDALPLHNDADYPAPLGSLFRTRFWHKRAEGAAPMTLDRTLTREQYAHKLADFVESLRTELMAMRGEATTPTIATVVLAQVTPDLDIQRDLVKSFLEQYHIKVLPEGSYPGGGADFAAAFSADCKKATHFIQLLGPWADRRPPDLSEGYANHQYDAAKQAGLVPLLWCRPDLPRDQVASHKDGRLFNAPELISAGIEEFKAEIVRLVTTPAKPPPPPPTPSNGFIFVDNDKADQALAKDLAAKIVGRKRLAFLRAFDGPPEDLLEDLEDSIINCSALVVVYGEARPTFVRAQLRLSDKLSPRRDGRPLKVLAVYAKPPAQRDQLGVELSPDIIWIDAAQQEGDAVIEQMITALGS